MITTVTGKHQVTIPAKLASHLGIVPGSRLEWVAAENANEIRVRIVPTKRTLANTLLGAGRKLIRGAKGSGRE